MTQLFIGLITEGTTDNRFLKPIIEKTLIDIAYNCRGQIDFYVKEIDCDKGESFATYVLNASKIGNQILGITILIVHTDADDSSKENAYNNKINQALASLEEESDETHCKNLVALVPIYETESWMLADKAAFIKSIGTNRNETELKISGDPETFTNPKEKIEEAIRIGRAEMPRKLRESLKISDLYSFLAETTKIQHLKNFESYIDFENNIKHVLRKLNLLDL